MGFDWYESDDTTLAGTSFTFTTSAGTPSAAIELHAWLNKGSSVGSSETRYLRLYVEDSGVYKTSGLDVLDRREIECRIIGSQNPDGVSEFSAPTTAWKPIGTRRSFQLPAIYPNCCIELEFRHNPTTEGGQSTPVTFRVRAVLGTGDVPMSIPDDVLVEGDLDFGGHELSNVALPGPLLVDMDTNGKKLANMYTPTIAETYVAAPVLFVLARPAKTHARLCATAPVTWSAVEAVYSGVPDDIDGETVVAEDRVLLTAETDATKNGKWIVKADAWVRHPDCEYAYLLYAGCFLYVREGTSNGRAVWMQTADIADLSTDPQTWEKAIALP